MGRPSVFIDVESLPDDIFGFIQVTYLLLTYGAIILFGSSLLSHGSELLLLVPEYSGIIGTIVLPVVGQLPDAVIVYFSGMGGKRTAQKQLDIGVGALSGSCVLLLTLPWVLSIMAGRVSIINGRPNYDGTPRLLQHSSLDALTTTGVELGPFVRRGSLIMMGTACTYLFLQIPGLMVDRKSLNVVAETEKSYALVGLLIATAMLICYLLYQLRVSQDADNVMLNRRESFVRRAIESGEVSVLGALLKEFRQYRPPKGWLSALDPPHSDSSIETRADACSKEETRLLPARNRHLRTLRNVLRPFFAKHDPGDGTLGVVELAAVICDLGELASTETVEFLTRFGFDSNGRVDFDEFVRGVLLFFENSSTGSHKEETAPLSLTRPPSMSSRPSSYGRSRTVSYTGRPLLKHASAFLHEDKEVELDPLPDDLRHLSPAQQQHRLKMRAAGRMVLGLVLIFIFSDPVVDAVNNIGFRMGVRPFYVAFVLTPLVTSSVEMLAAYSYAVKQSRKSIGVSLSMLQGAVCMNNTLVLGVFMYLVFAKGLAWQFLSETLTVLLVQVFVGVYGLKRIHTPLDGLVILSVYPLSIALIAILEQNGWD